MAFRTESTVKSLFARPIEAWVWPLTAAIVLGGSILFWSLAGLFWLAMHPAERSVVIWMAPGTNAEQRDEASASQVTTAAEGRDDAQAN
jgi:hypothetical protein